MNEHHFRGFLKSQHAATKLWSALVTHSSWALANFGEI